MNRPLYLAALATGLATVGWMAAGYAGHNPLALVMTLLIAAFYALGAWELHRYQQATAGLQQALGALPPDGPADDAAEGLAAPGSPAALQTWLGTVPDTLRSAVRLRIGGERVPLPAPALTPYLAGLLVLLGMLGTFLGMVVTLQGTVMALENTSDLQAIRASLAAPVKGLGLAFGTSVAGVAASAMLGLMAALCRRSRLQAGLLLDGLLAGPLRRFTPAHRREQQQAQQQQALQAQATLLPQLVERLHDLMSQLQQQDRARGDQLLAGQAQLQQHTQAAYGALASSVDRSLQHSLSESTRVATAALQPVVQATMDGISRHTQALHDSVAHGLQQQLDGLAMRFEHSVNGVAQGWAEALARQDSGNQALQQGLHRTLQALAEGFDQRSASLVTAMTQTATSLQATLAQQTAALADTLVQHAGTLDSTLTQHALSLVGTLSQQQAAAQAELTGTVATLAADTHRQQQAAQQAAATQLDASAAAFAQQAGQLVQQLAQAQAEAQAAQAAQEHTRAQAWQQQLQALVAELQQQWERAATHALARQQQICQTLERTAHDISTQAQDQAQRTLAEIGTLLHTAAEAPRVAAEVIAQLREQLSHSLVQDNALLSERQQVMQTLATLLAEVQHASSAQRGAIDALVAAAGDMLSRAGQQFQAQLQAESARVADAAAQVSGSAIDMASLGEAFSHGVQLYSSANDRLLAQLHTLEAAQDKTRSRSDEQLAYTVAQARELIDLSLLQQKQVIDQLQLLAQRQALPAAAAAAAAPATTTESA